MKKVIIGSDHGGFRLKKELLLFLKKKGFAVTDAGTYSEERCDYTDTAAAVADKVSHGVFKRGILVCKSGIGNSIVANRFPGVRAALCHSIRAARLSREHNDSNILCLGALFTGTAVSKRALTVWLNTAFAGGRHARRLAKIRDIETIISTYVRRRR
jgi:ribose 5-phosphate isomerase B